MIFIIIHFPSHNYCNKSVKSYCIKTCTCTCALDLPEMLHNFSIIVFHLYIFNENLSLPYRVQAYFIYHIYLLKCYCL